MLIRVNGTKFYEQVVSQIKTMIEQGVYKKGDMLPSEKELMQLTGVSRITVREALKILAEVGLIKTQKGKGSFVLADASAFNPDAEAQRQRSEYRDTFIASSRARLIIEPEIARQAALMAGEQDVGELRKVISVKTPSTAGEQNFDDFHRTLIQITGNKLLIKFINDLIALENESPLGLVLIPPENQKRVAAELNHQHKKILKAIEEKNGEFAYFYMKEHMSYLLAVYEDYFEKFM
jgi:GntR family transcriptional repressor for pyruvate dehydrogenase complex